MAPNVPIVEFLPPTPTPLDYSILSKQVSDNLISHVAYLYGKHCLTWLTQTLSIFNDYVSYYKLEAGLLII